MLSMSLSLICLPADNITFQNYFQNILEFHRPFLSTSLVPVTTQIWVAWLTCWWEWVPHNHFAKPRKSVFGLKSSINYFFSLKKKSSNKNKNAKQRKWLEITMDYRCLNQHFAFPWEVKCKNQKVYISNHTFGFFGTCNFKIQLLQNSLGQSMSEEVTKTREGGNNFVRRRQMVSEVWLFGKTTILIKRKSIQSDQLTWT